MSDKRITEVGRKDLHEKWRVMPLFVSQFFLRRKELCFAGKTRIRFGNGSPRKGNKYNVISGFY